VLSEPNENPLLVWSKKVVGVVDVERAAADWTVFPLDELLTACWAARPKKAANPRTEANPIRLLRRSTRACCRRRTSV
jgi:hypothetical protein